MAIKLESKIESLLNDIGVKLNGNGPSDIKINDPRFLQAVIQKQSIGAGESYVAGWWDCEKLDDLFFKICRYGLEEKFNPKLSQWTTQIVNSLINQQSRSRAEEVSNVHYNLGNILFEYMLGKSMAYTCGYWKNANTLDEAEFAKYDLVCRKLYLKPGETVLEIGSGWGGLAKYMAENYQVQVVAMDVGKEPARYAKEHCKNLPVTIYEGDYRDTHLYNPKGILFDKIVSVGVLEHVGCKNYKTLLDIAKRFLKPEGIFLLHSIGGNVSTNHCNPWINKYIFPNGMLPSLKQLGEAFEHRFIVEDLQNFGAYYDKTLQGWYKNLNENWDKIKAAYPHYDEKLRRMMNYYLLSCAGAFRARSMQLWQFVLSHEGLVGGYESVR